MFFSVHLGDMRTSWPLCYPMNITMQLVSWGILVSSFNESADKFTWCHLSYGIIDPDMWYFWLTVASVSKTKCDKNADCYFKLWFSWQLMLRNIWCGSYCPRFQLSSVNICESAKIRLNLVYQGQLQSSKQFSTAFSLISDPTPISAPPPFPRGASNSKPWANDGEAGVLSYIPTV